MKPILAYIILTLHSVLFKNLSTNFTHQDRFCVLCGSEGSFYWDNKHDDVSDVTRVILDKPVLLTAVSSDTTVNSILLQV